jgi:hypothetical protein
MIPKTIAVNTEVTFKWSEEIEREYNGTVGDLPEAIRDRLLGRPLSDEGLREGLESRQSLLDSQELRDMSDILDERIDTIHDVFILI